MNHLNKEKSSNKLIKKNKLWNLNELLNNNIIATPQKIIHLKMFPQKRIRQSKTPDSFARKQIISRPLTKSINRINFQHYRIKSSLKQRSDKMNELRNNQVRNTNNDIRSKEIFTLQRKNSQPVIRQNIRQINKQKVKKRQQLTRKQQATRKQQLQGIINMEKTYKSIEMLKNKNIKNNIKYHVEQNAQDKYDQNYFNGLMTRSIQFNKSNDYLMKNMQNRSSQFTMNAKNNIINLSKQFDVHHQYNQSLLLNHQYHPISQVSKSQFFNPNCHSNNQYQKANLYNQSNQYKRNLEYNKSHQHNNPQMSPQTKKRTFLRKGASLQKQIVINLLKNKMIKQHQFDIQKQYTIKDIMGMIKLYKGVYNNNKAPQIQLHLRQKQQSNIVIQKNNKSNSPTKTKSNLKSCPLNIVQQFQKSIEGWEIQPQIQLEFQNKQLNENNKQINVQNDNRYIINPNGDKKNIQFTYKNLQSQNITHNSRKGSTNLLNSQN